MLVQKWLSAPTAATAFVSARARWHRRMPAHGKKRRGRRRRVRGARLVTSHLFRSAASQQPPFQPAQLWRDVSRRRIRRGWTARDAAEVDPPQEPHRCIAALRWLAAASLVLVLSTVVPLLVPDGARVEALAAGVATLVELALDKRLGNPAR